MIKYEELADTYEQWLQQEASIAKGIESYIFLCRDIENKYSDCLEGYYDKPKHLRQNLQKVIPFSIPDSPPMDEWFELCRVSKELLNKYFINIFVYGNFDKPHPLDLNEIFAIIIPKEKVDVLNKLMEVNKLNDFKDLIFYLIAQIQKFYHDHIEYYQNKKRQKEIKEFSNECKKMIEVVTKHYARKNYEKDKTSPPDLVKITFGFRRELNENIAITDPVLLLRIMKLIAPTPYDKVKYREWQKHIGSLPRKIYTNNHNKNNYKKNLAQSLLLFLKETKQFKSKNDICIFIGRVYELALLIKDEKEFLKDKLALINYKVGHRSKISAYDKYLLQNIKALLQNRNEKAGSKVRK